MAAASWRLLICASLASSLCLAQEPERPGQPINLPTALELAGAQNLDVALARERLAEAHAAQESAHEQFLPWLSPGASYRRHDGRIQAVEGPIIDASKQSYAAGAAVTAQVDVGDAYFKTLAAHQLVAAAGHALDAQRQDAVLAAARGYFELARSQAAVDIRHDAVRISQEYEDQLHRAVSIGIAFKGDALRVQVQTERDRLGLQQVEAQRRIAAARLAQTLHLNAAVELVAHDADLVPLALSTGDATLPLLVSRALASRPELQQSHSLIAAARDTRAGAVYGPMIPTVGAQVIAGGLGGGVDGETGRFGGSEDYLAGLSWRIGPGGLFDMGRIHAAESRLQSSELMEEKLKDEITREVVEEYTRVESLADQLATAQHALAAAEETLRLTRERKEFAVGNVLENIQAEQELTRTRDDYVGAIAQYDGAQYALRRAVGATPNSSGQ